MEFSNKQININKGYAILFAVVIVSIISMISVGLSNTAYKQLVLSSLASNSQTAYFQSDMATECALYADFVKGVSSITSPWNCGVDSSGHSYSLTVQQPPVTADVYEFKPSNTSSTLPCFDFTIDKSVSNNTPPKTTTVTANGYNSCDKTNPRTVEREILVNY